MIIDDTATIYLLLMSNAVLLSAAALAVIRFRQQCERLERFWSSPTGAAIADRKSEQDRLQIETMMRLEQNLSDLQTSVNALADRPRKQTAPVAQPLPIDNAVRMIRNGASIEDLTQTCGLNIGEARLLTKMHGVAASAKTA